MPATSSKVLSGLLIMRSQLQKIATDESLLPCDSVYLERRKKKFQTTTTVKLLKSAGNQQVRSKRGQHDFRTLLADADAAMRLRLTTLPSVSKS